MQTIRQSWNPAEKGSMFDPSTGIQGATPMSQDPKMMNSLYSILTLSLFFYERITRPFEGHHEDEALGFVQGSAFGS